jgi:beta-galactosidase
MITAMELHQRFGKDGVATVLLRNILKYWLQNADFSVPALTTVPFSFSRIKRDDVSFVDLRPYVTRSFIDKVAGDKKGGWDDNGPDNDISALPTGIQYFKECPYDIIEPDKNNDKSCILLKGEPRMYFPAEITGIKVGRKLKWLKFLQTGCYMSKKYGNVAEYIIHYVDGKKEIVPVIAGQNIADWTGQQDLPDARVVWQGHEKNFPSGIGIYSYHWENPRPDAEIKSIDYIKTGDKGIPVLIAVTGGKL